LQKIKTLTCRQRELLFVYGILSSVDFYELRKMTIRVFVDNQRLYLVILIKSFIIKKKTIKKLKY